MASRTSAALIAALLAAGPAGVALAQTATDAAKPVIPPAATQAAEAAKDATDTAAKAAETAADAATDAAKETAAPAADAAKDAAAGAADAAKDAADKAGEAVDAAKAAETPAAETPATEPAPETAPAKPGAPEYYTKSTQGDWTLRCMKTPDGKDPCELYQLLKDQKGTPVSEISVIPFSGKAAAIINVVAPLETDLQLGLGLQIDAGKNNAYPFMVCAPIGCIARIGMTEGELGALKKGNAINLSLLPFGADPEKNIVKLSASLKGFTAGFDELSKIVKETQTAKP